MPGTVPKKVKKNPTTWSADSLGHDYLANKDFTVMELIHIFFLPPIRGSKAPIENIIRNKLKGSAFLKYFFLWASSPVHNLNIPNTCSPSGLWPLTGGVPLPCLSQGWGKIIAAAQFTTGSDVNLDLHQSRQDSAPAPSLLLCTQTPTKH